MSDRLRAIVGSVVFLFVAPGVVAGLIPWGISGYRMEPAFLGFEPFRWLGMLLLILGGVLLAETFARFHSQPNSWSQCRRVSANTGIPRRTCTSTANVAQLHRVRHQL